jgi:simple sugar transport system ATP-binding protein
MSEEILNVSHISKSFSGVSALNDVSLTIKAGEIHCLIGENGSGKSTLIKIIAGVYEPDEGEIVINNHHYSRLTPIESIREGIQVIYQDFSLFPNLTVAENIALNYQLERNKNWVDWGTVRKIAQNALDRINVKLNLDALVGEMPVADKQLIAISRALLQDARLIIMDEPTTALTQKEVSSLFSVIKDLQKQGISILFVSHKLNEVLDISERTMVLRNGQIVVDADASEFDTKKMVYYMTGHHVVETAYVYEENTSNEPPLLKVENLTSRNNFYDISFELKAGEILGVTGLLGSGRTGLALSLFGVFPADSGSISIDGVQVKINSIQDAIDKKIGYVPEDRLTEGLFLDQEIGKNMVVRIVDDLKGSQKLINQKSLQVQIQDWIEQLNIKTSSSQLPVKSLSGGNQQRVVLAKWLASCPRILILNGPTVGVDIGSKAELHEALRVLAKKGMGLLIMSDDIPELMQTCNRILLMRKGRIVEEFQREIVTEDELTHKLVEA